VDNSYKWAGGGFLSNVQDLVKFGNAMLFSFQRKSEPVQGKSVQPGGPVQQKSSQPAGPVQENSSQPAGPVQENSGRPGGPVQENISQPGGPVQENSSQPGGSLQEKSQPAVIPVEDTVRKVEQESAERPDIQPATVSQEIDQVCWAIIRSIFLPRQMIFLAYFEILNLCCGSKF
jgi:hypothetical protein